MMSVIAISMLAMLGQVIAAPHILLMVLDDVGRADTGIYGKSNIPMPHLQQLSKDGVVFDNFYTQTVCSPTRSSLLTGQFPFRFGMQHYTTQLPGMTAGVPLDVPMLPALLREKGYERHMIGKWHCGYATWGHTPMQKGFQSYTGYLQAQGDYYKHNIGLTDNSLGVLDGFDFWKDKRVMHEAKGNYSLDIYRGAMKEVLYGYAARHETPEQRKEHPLFVYLAHQTVHIPLEYRAKESRCDSIAHSTRKIYCYMLVELDDAIKEMVNDYKALDLWDNLLILTLTDNGGMVNFNPNEDENNFPIFPASQGSNYPLRGSKTTMFEGGVRSLAFASGGIIPSEARNRRVKDLAHVVDFSATILAAAQIYPLRKEELKLDGYNLWSIIMNHPGAASPRDHVPINVVAGGNRYSAVRFGPFKVIVDDFLFASASGWFDANGDLKESSPDIKGKTLLFNVDEDPEERKDLSADMPHVVQYGKDLISMYVKGNNYMEPQDSTMVHPQALPIFHHGVWKPFMTESAWTEKYEESRIKQQKKREAVKVNDEDVVEEDLADEEKEAFLEPLVAEKRRQLGLALRSAERKLSK